MQSASPPDFHREGPGARWSPIVGPETIALLDHLGLPQESRFTLQAEAASILARCVPPTCPNDQETGLVIGYIQSGKTMSFTTIAALARDNDYRLVIVLSGLTKSLFEQSRRRLEDDLRANGDRHRWLPRANPRVRSDLDSIMVALNTRHSVHGPRTVLLTVMKNRAHLDQLISLLSQLPLDQVPVLVIDDEADQASLNNEVRSGGESATYRRLVTIRARLPHHTYLQYTATPQAPLLINLIDVLAPKFAEVLTPGSAYTGGRVFFEGEFELVRRIPPSEVPTRKNALTEPPESLLAAMRMFFLGVAAGRLAGQDSQDDNRSMMIHPSMQRADHAEYRRWVRAIKRRWTTLLAVGEGAPNDHDYLDFFEDLHMAHADLGFTMEGLPPLEDLVSHFQEGIDQTIVVEVNSRGGPTPEVDWRQHYAHILVGGEVLNRGFTIEGLTVSYMPRGLGTRQADTIQQRARWFGYKEDYLGYCRVYLPDQASGAYRDYVAHEENMREQLRVFHETGRPLSEWKRAFFLAPALRPTRDIVLDLDYVRGNFSDRWYDPAAPHESENAVVANRELVGQLVARFKNRFHPDEGDPRRTQEQIHLIVMGLSLQEVYEEFLTKLRFTQPSDSAKYTGLLLQVGKHLEEHEDDLCAIYQMKSGRTRERGLDNRGEILNLFQGHNPEDARPADRIYPGDRGIHAPDVLTIQLHRLDLKHNGNVVAADVPAVAVWVPRRMSAHWISQQQG